MKRFYGFFMLCISFLLCGMTMNAQSQRTLGHADGYSVNRSPQDFSSVNPVVGQQVADVLIGDPSADDEPLTLYGALVQRNSWNQSGAGAFGMYKFDVASDQSQLDFEPLFLDDRMISTSPGCYVDGKYYLFYPEILYGYMFNGLYMIVFDAETGEVLQETLIDGASQQDVPYSLTYDPISKYAYGYCQRNGLENHLCKVDLQTGKIVEDVGVMLDDVFFVMQFSATGVLYGISNRGNLYTIDTKTAECTLVGNTGWEPLFNQSGAIDQRSGRMFWAYYTFNSGALLEVDLETAATTKIVDFPDGENFIGLHTRTALADDQAPSAPTDLAVRFAEAGSLTATFTADAPTQTFDGGVLTSDVDVTFFVDDVEAGTVAGVSPGEAAEFTYTFTSEGKHRVSVMASVGDDDSPKLTVETYAGYDTPLPVTDVNLSIDGQGRMTLTWTAPGETGVNNGRVDTDDLTYRVIQYPASVVVSEDNASTTYSGHVTDEGLANYSFGVIAKSQGRESAEARSNRVQYGDAISVPFTEDFETNLNWELYTVTDANHDGYTWIWDNGRAAYQGYSCPNQASDWLFTPPIRMREGITYSLYVTFDGGYWQTENFKIVASPGKDLTNPGMEILYDKTGEFTYQQVQANYKAPSDGEFYFGFQCYSAANVRGIQIDSYSVVASEAPDAPDVVRNLKAEAAGMGVLSATLSFDAPTTTVSGDHLSDGDITSISIYRQGEFVPVKTFESPAPGQSFTWVDENAIHGTNYYYVVSYGETGNSRNEDVEVWVGEDYASQPLDFEVTVNRDNGTVTFNWDRPSGALHGGYIDWDNVTYTIQFIVPELTEDLIDVASGIKDLTYTDSEVLQPFLSITDQYDIIFAIYAVTSAGYGQPATADASSGEAYTLPYWESFSNGYLSTAPWTYSSDDVTNADSWLLVEDTNSPFGVTSYDNDGGAAMFYQQDLDAEARLIGPRINLDGTDEPLLRFYMYHDISVDETDNYLQIEARPEAGDGQYIKIGEPIAVNNGMYGWIMHELPLSSLVGEGEFRLAFFGCAQQGVDFYVDNISIREKQDWGFPTVNDLSGMAVDGLGVHLSWTEPVHSDAYTLLGYEVYVDEQLYNEEVMTATECDVELLDGTEHTFYVVAVYEDGKSDISNIVEVTAPSGIEDNQADGVKVYAGHGNVTVETPGNEIMLTICSADGKVMFAGLTGGLTVIPVDEGIYIVNAGGHVQKVSVR